MHEPDGLPLRYKGQPLQTSLAHPFSIHQRLQEATIQLAGLSANKTLGTANMGNRRMKTTISPPKLPTTPTRPAPPLRCGHQSLHTSPNSYGILKQVCLTGVHPSLQLTYVPDAARTTPHVTIKMQPPPRTFIPSSDVTHGVHFVRVPDVTDIHPPEPERVLPRSDRMPKRCRPVCDTRLPAPRPTVPGSTC